MTEGAVEEEALQFPFLSSSAGYSDAESTSTIRIYGLMRLDRRRSKCGNDSFCEEHRLSTRLVYNITYRRARA